MKITNMGRDARTGLTRYFIDQPVWVNGKKHGTHIHRIALGSENLAQKIAEVKNLSGSSLTKSTFAEGIDLTVKENGGAGMPAVYSVLKNKIGKHPVDNRFTGVFWNFIDQLRNSGRAENTISNYKSAAQHTLRRMEARGLIQSVPIKDFQIRRTFRSRVWTVGERNSIYGVMERINSHLYWSVYFSERNPIRCRSDLWKLRRASLVLVGANAPYIRYQPKKTDNRCPGKATLSGIDDRLLRYWEWLYQEFPDCPLLFPRVLKRKGKAYGWQAIGNPVKHWRHVCDLAEVADLKFHDIRHVGITEMLKAGWTRDQLKKLGIQHTDKAISIYDHTSADDVLAMGPASKKAEKPEEEALCIAQS